MPKTLLRLYASSPEPTAADVGDSGVLAGNKLGYAFNDRVVLDAAVNGLELVYIDRKGLSAFTGCSFAAAEAVGYL